MQILREYWEGQYRLSVPVLICSLRTQFFLLFQIAPFLWINQEINPNGFEIYFEIICNFLPPLRGDQRANRANQMDELIYGIEIKNRRSIGFFYFHQPSKKYKVVPYHTLHTRSQNALKDTFETFKTIDFNNCSYLNNTKDLDMETAFFVQAPPTRNIFT